MLKIEENSGVLRAFCAYETPFSALYRNNAIWQNGIDQVNSGAIILFPAH